MTSYKDKLAVLLLSVLLIMIVMIVGGMVCGCGGIDVKLPAPEATASSTPGERPTAPDSSVIPEIEAVTLPTPAPTDIPIPVKTGKRVDSDTVLSIDNLPLTGRNEFQDCKAPLDFVNGIKWWILTGDPSDLSSAEMLVRVFVNLSYQFDPSIEGGCRTALVTFPRAVRWTVPPTLVVEGGNAGNGRVYLSIGGAVCIYNGQADVADPLHPYRANQAEKGRTLKLNHCRPNCYGEPALNGKTVGIISFSGAIPLNVSIKLEGMYPIYTLDEIVDP
jgi:hypothetical protein